MVISQNGDYNCQPRSCDLTPMNFMPMLQQQFKQLKTILELLFAKSFMRKVDEKLHEKMTFFKKTDFRKYIVLDY